MREEPELRCDPVTGRWAIIAPERSRRPIALSGAGPRHRTTGERTPCPFCPGQEHDTPNEVLAYREPGTVPNGPGWRLRVVPNKFPAVRLNVELAGSEATLLESDPAVGVAEVLIDCPEHIDNPTLLSDEQFRDVLRAYRERIIALASDQRLAHVAIFKNVGAEAGASLGHTHSQLIASSIVPEFMEFELTGSEAYFTHCRRCVFCDIMKQELAADSRIVARTEHFVALTAFAPRFAYEMWVLPVRHESRYESITDAAAMELAHLMKRILRALDASQHSPAYNWFLHTAPLHAADLPHYHWHLEIMPRTSCPAGFEWGYGTHITTVTPEHAAEQLRSVVSE